MPIVTGDRLGAEPVHPRQQVTVAGRAQRAGQRFEQERVPAGAGVTSLAQPVIGIPDRFWGEAVGAAISTSSAAPPAETELAGFCRARLAAYKVPVRWLFTSVFPLTATGKVRKDVLSAQLAEANAPVTIRGRGAATKVLGRQTGRPGDPGQPAAEHTPATHEAQVARYPAQNARQQRGR